MNAANVKIHPKQTTIYNVSKTEIDCRYTIEHIKKVKPLKNLPRSKIRQSIIQF